MRFLEKDLEEIIIHTDNAILANRGLFIHGKKASQVYLGAYGIVDVISFHRSRDTLHINVFEIKRDVVNVNTFLQTIRYCKGILRFFEKRRVQYTVSLSINLVGRTIDKDSDLIYLPDLFEGTDVIYKSGIRAIIFFTYFYDFDGIRFENERCYALTNEKF